LSGLLERPEPVRPAELVPGFSLDRVPREPAVVPADMLERLSGGR